MSVRYLADKSALIRWGQPPVAKILDRLDSLGLLATCGAVEYEVLFSARGKKDALRLRTFMRAFGYLPANDEVWDRVLEVQSEALNSRFHRALSMADLLIAATAERHGATVLHYDGDYEMIASITGQPVRWVVPAGTAD